MKITSIKQQLKRKDRYAVYIDGKYSFSLGELELINSGLKVGQQLAKEELDKLQDTAKLDKMYDRVLNYLAIRPRSEWEIREYLRRKDSPAAQAKVLLNKLSNTNLINDEAFAKAWVENRHLLKPISRRRLIQELRQKRIANDTIDKVLAEDQTDEHEVLRELVSKKRRQSRYQDDLKLMQYLSRQGYNYNDIKSVLNGMSDDQ